MVLPRLSGRYRGRQWASRFDWERFPDRERHRRHGNSRLCPQVSACQEPRAPRIRNTQSVVDREIDCSAFHWSEGSRFLLYRDGLTIPDPQPAVAGYGPELSNRLFPSSGPYSIDDRPGPGTGRGQLNQPRGIAVATGDGAILVVDMGNGRVERYSSGGSYEATWGGPESDIGFNVTPEGLGPTGIAVGFDGLVYVADTWNHRIVVLNQAGQLVREFGTFADTLDAEDPSVQPGAFFGPRSIATTATEIFVTDTGNERVQVFAPDGTFLRAWGGFGSGPDQLIEPVGIGISPDGRVFVADSGNGRISVFARDGTPLEQWPVAAWSGQQFFEPYLTFDRWGRLYATSAATGSIEVFDLDGTFLISISDGTKEQLEAPVGIASALDGSLLVTDRSIGAVVRVALLPEPEEADISAEASPTVGSPTAAGTPEPEA